MCFFVFPPLTDAVAVLSQPVLERLSGAVLGKLKLPQKYDDRSSAKSSSYIHSPLPWVMVNTFPLPVISHFPFASIEFLTAKRKLLSPA